jgi:5-methyltetrahydrofolate--homocysteine methyltransferase
MSTDDNSANVTLETVRRIKAQGGKTVLGVSNISFGLPQREVVNSAFFSLAMSAGLSAGIINPNSAAMRQAYDTFCVLGGFDSQCMGYIEKYAVAPEVAAAVTNTSVGSSGASGAKTAAPAGTNAAAKSEITLSDCIVKGLKEQAYKATQKELETKEPLTVINEGLVPALDIVGKGFEKGTVFLPQLLMSAEAAKAGFEAIKEFMQKSGTVQEKKATIVIATVKGDIHDIGKNIVKVLLENYGYNVIDLGKDVPPEAIVDAVVENHAPLCGLSALMTTTVVNMEETIKQLRKSAPWCKVMVGGAVLTQEYADMIGADFYGKDAMQSVYYAERLLGGKE